MEDIIAEDRDAALDIYAENLPGGADLSGGRKQRLAIAGTIAQRLKILKYPLCSVIFSRKTLA